MIRALKMLRAGRCAVDASILLNRKGALVMVPIWVYLIDSDDGLILVDSGMPPECTYNPRYFDGTEDEGKIVPVMEPTDQVDKVLQRQGLVPSDIDAVVSTHWHFDHAGGNRILRDRPILVHPAEVEAAKRGAYTAECRDLTIPYQLVRDGEQPIPGLTLLHTPGHTSGHLSLLLDMADGSPIILTVDAVYTAENWLQDRLGAMADPEAGQKSVQRLKDIAQQTGARVFFGHDNGQADDPQWRSHIS